MSRLNWAIFNGEVFESLVHAILFFEDPTIVLFGRPGADAGQDAITEDKTHVYQAKYGRMLTFSEAIKRAKDELAKIRNYKNENDPHFRHWRMVTHWTLVCNASSNPSDCERWQAEVVDQFGDLEMELDYWDATILEAKLTNYPDIENAYWGGKNRCFLGMWEAQKYLESGLGGDIFFQSQFLNQKQASQVFDTFLTDSTKKILILEGAQGSGKTRFLYEHALELCENRYIPFWGLSATMEVSDSWFLGIINSKKALCLIVDNATPALLKRLYEQLTIVGRSSWKVIASIDDKISNLHLEKYKQRCDTLVASLVPLNVSDISNYMKAFGYTPERIKPHSIEQRLLDLTRGNPRTLSIILSENSPNDERISLTQNVLENVNEYIETRLAQSGFNGFFQKQQLLLRWIAVYKTIRISHSQEKSPLYDFLCQETNCTASELQDNLTDLVKNKLLICWGKKETYYTIDSDLICCAILQEWLLQRKDNDVYQLNIVGNSFINGLLKKNIPCLDIALRNLSLFAKTYSLKEQEKFFSPLFIKISNECLSDGILACKKGLQSLNQIAHLDSETALSVLSDIWTHAETCRPECEQTWSGDVLYSFKDLFLIIEDVLFSIAYAIENSVSSSLVWELIKRYQKNITILTPMEQSQFYHRLCALLIDIDVGNYYCDLAYAECTPLNEFPSNFHFAILKSLVTPKHKSTTSYKREITFSSYYIVPNSEGWNIATALRKSLFERLQEANISEDVESAYWQILINTHNQWRDIDHLRHPNLPIEKQLYAIALEDLNETHKIISTKQIPLKTLLLVRQMWEYALRYPKDQTEKQITEQCEKVFKTYFKWDFARLFSWHEKNEANNLVGDIVAFIENAKTAEEINLFFTSATAFLNLKENSYDCNRSQEILTQTFDLYAYKKQSAFCEFINTEIKHAKGFGTFKDNFFVLFLKRWIHFIKVQEGGQLVSQELIRLLNDSPTKGELLYSVYAKSAPSSLGGTTTDEFDYLFSHRNDFTIEQFIEILPTFLNVAEKETQKFVLNTFEQNKNNSQQLNKLWFRFADAAYNVILCENNLDVPNPISWLMQAFINFNINGKYLGEYSIERLAEFGKFKISQVDFLSLIEQRITLVQEGVSHFEILPNDFQVDKWVSRETNNDVIQSLCKIVFNGESYFASRQLPKYLPSLTQDTTPIVNFINATFTENSELSFDMFYRLGLLASSYSDETLEWEQIVTPILQKVRLSGITQGERYQIYHSLQDRSQVYGFRIGDIPSEIIQRKEFIEKKIVRERIPKCLEEYWHWSLGHVQRDFDHFSDEAEADRYE